MSVGFSEEAVTVIAVLTGLLIVVSLAIYIFNRIKYKNRSLPTGIITKRRDISNILNWALDDRSKIELSFERIDNIRQIIACSLLDITRHSLMLELPGYLNIVSSWKGRIVECFFSVVVEKNKRIFYSFKAEILELKSDTNLPILHIEFPSILELKQKRLHLRIEPMFKHVAELEVWPAVYKGPYPLNNLLDWGRPLSKLSQESKGKILLENISAGGIRLKFNPAELSFPRETFERGKQLFLHFGLVKPNKNDVAHYYVLGRIQNLFQDYESKIIETGIQFLYEGIFEEDKISELKWVKIKAEEGIVELGNWVFKRHLELYRTFGLT